MNTHPPTAEGWFQFSGTRITPSGKFQVTVKDVVKVIARKGRAGFVVLHAGSTLQYSTQMYSGQWKRVTLPSEGEA